MTEIAKETAKEEGFKKFGSKFQLATLSLLIQDKAFTNSIKDIIRPEYFDNVYSAWICRMVLEQIEMYHVPPSFDDLKMLVETKLTTGHKLYLLHLDAIKKADLSRKEFYEKEAKMFCFTRHALAKLEEEKTSILMGDFDSARSIAYQTYKPLGESIRRFDLKKDIEDVFKEKQHIPIPTPLPSLNLVSKGGPGAGDLAIVVAFSNVGKSTFLCAAARHAVLNNYNVAFFSLETNNMQLAYKVLSGLVGVNQEDLQAHPERVKEKVAGLPANIRFVQIKATEAKIETIRQQVDVMKSEGFFPDFLCVDGLNQLKLPKGIKKENNNDKFEYLAEELRDYAGELQVPVWTTFQANRSAANADYVDEQMIGKAIEPLQVADYLLFLSQTTEMLEANRALITLLKNRLGPKGLCLELSYDPNRGVFIELASVQRSLLRSQKDRSSMQSGISIAKKRLENIRS